MGRIDYRDGLIPDMPNDKSCHFCGGRSVAYWFGHRGYLFVCSACALKVLPKLLADSQFLRDDKIIDDAKADLIKAEKSYWEAIASRCSALLRKK